MQQYYLFDLPRVNKKGKIGKTLLALVRQSFFFSRVEQLLNITFVNGSTNVLVSQVQQYYYKRFQLIYYSDG